MKEQEVKDYIGTEFWNSFLEFMEGQTVSLNPDGSTDFYDIDVERFKSRLERIAEGSFERELLSEDFD